MLQQQFRNDGRFIASDTYYDPLLQLKPAEHSSEKLQRWDQILWSVYKGEMKCQVKTINRNSEDRSKMHQVTLGQFSNQNTEMISGG